jgi:hypothetical protein
MQAAVIGELKARQGHAIDDRGVAERFRKTFSSSGQALRCSTLTGHPSTRPVYLRI